MFGKFHVSPLNSELGRAAGAHPRFVLTISWLAELALESEKRIAFTKMANSVRIEDIDFSRGVVGIAFMMRQATRSSPPPLSVDDATSPEDSGRQTWSGIFPTIKSTINTILSESYANVANYIHCELCFFTSSSGFQRLGPQYMIACSTRQGSCVKVVAREFNRTYKYLYLKVTEIEQRQIVNFLFSQVGRPYDIAAALRALSWPRKTDGSRWFCSELTFFALKFISCPVIQTHRADCIEIDELHGIVCSSPRLVRSSANITPNQIKQIYEETKDDDAFSVMFQSKVRRQTSARVVEL